MSPELQEFIVQVSHISLAKGRNDPAVHRAVSDRFYEYLHAVGVEHCNFGGFQLTDEGKGDVHDFAGSLLPEPFLEEFTAELACDDYVVLKADELKAHKPIDRFRIGLPTLDEVGAFNARSRIVQAECARHGIEDGFAIIGNTTDLDKPGPSRFYGFVFAGEISAGDHIRGMAGELEVASQILLDRIQPWIMAHAAGFGYDLTDRELDVLAWLTNGLQRQEIAHRLSISVATVDMHLANLRRKLAATTLAEAAAKAIRYGLLN